MDYYWISIRNSKVSTIAYAPKGTPASHELIEMMVEKKAVPFSLEVHSVEVKASLCVGEVSDVFYDYQPNSLAWPVMSDRLKTIIDTHLTGAENIEWKEILVRGASTTAEYYVPMFMSRLDTLNDEGTIYAPLSGVIMKPCFDKKKIENLAVFHGHDIFWRISTQIFVNEDIKREIINAGIDEVSFSKVLIK